MSVNSTNPGDLFGGTWTRFGQGRAVVGIDEDDTDFAASEKLEAKKRTL